MAVSASDLQWRLSGGGSNASASASTGGAMSTQQVGAALFSDVDATSSGVGLTDYRCVYLLNMSSEVLPAGVLYLSANTASAYSHMTLAVEAELRQELVGAASNVLGSGPLAGDEIGQTPYDAGSLGSAAGLAWGDHGSVPAGIALPDIPAGGRLAVWFRRAVLGGAPASSDTWSVAVEWDGAAGREVKSLATSYVVDGAPAAPTLPRKRQRVRRTSRYF